MLSEAIKKAGYTGKVDIAMDCAASEFYKDGKYDLDFKNPNSLPCSKLDSAAMCKVYQEMIGKYPIVSIEDPFDQDDWQAWPVLTGSCCIQVIKTLGSRDRKSVV